MAHYAKTPAVRRGILEACVAAFGESGFHGASMAEIARRAGISHTGLLHHFPRKSDLLTAAIELQDQRAAEYLASRDDDASTDAAANLRGMIAALTDTGRPLGLIELSTVLSGEAAVPSHPAHQHFADRYASIRGFLTRVYRSLAEDGRLASDVAPELLAMSTVALLEGLQKQRLYDPSLDLDAAASGILGALVPELLPKPPVA